MENTIVSLRTDKLSDECKRHNKANGGYAKFDCQGIFKFYYCDKCIETKKAKFIPSTWTGYTQADCYEDIEPDDMFPQQYYYDY